MAVARVGRRLEAEAAVDLEPRVAGEVADVPEGVGLALEEGDDDGAPRGEGAEGVVEEGDEEGLVVADLAVDVGGLAADVGEVEEDAGGGRARGRGGEGPGCVDAVDDLVLCSDAYNAAGLVWFLCVIVLVLLFFFFLLVVGLRWRRRGGRDGCDVLEGVGILFRELVGGLLEDGRDEVHAAVVGREGGGEAQVALSDEQDAVLRIERDRRLLVLLLLVGGIRALLRLRLSRLGVASCCSALPRLAFLEALRVGLLLLGEPAPLAAHCPEARRRGVSMVGGCVAVSLVAGDVGSE